MLGFLFDMCFNARGKSFADRADSLNRLYSNQRQALMSSSPVYFHPRYGWVDSCTGRRVSIDYRGPDKVALDHYTQKLVYNLTELENKDFNYRAETYAKKVGHKSYIGRVKEPNYITKLEIPIWQWKNRLVEIETGKEIELEFHYHKCKDDIWVYQCVKKSFDIYKDLKDFIDNNYILDDRWYRKLIKTEYISLKEYFELYLSYYYIKYNSRRNDIWEGNLWQDFHFKYKLIEWPCESSREDGLNSRYIFNEDKLDKTRFINSYEINPDDLVEFETIGTGYSSKTVYVYKGDKS